MRNGCCLLVYVNLLFSCRIAVAAVEVLSHVEHLGVIESGLRPAARSDVRDVVVENRRVCATADGCHPWGTRSPEG